MAAGHARSAVAGSHLRSAAAGHHAPDQSMSFVPAARPCGRRVADDAGRAGSGGRGRGRPPAGHDGGRAPCHWRGRPPRGHEGDRAPCDGRGAPLGCHVPQKVRRGHRRPVPARPGEASGATTHRCSSSRHVRAAGTFVQKVHWVNRMSGPAWDDDAPRAAAGAVRPPSLRADRGSPTIGRIPSCPPVFRPVTEGHVSVTPARPSRHTAPGVHLLQDVGQSHPAQPPPPGRSKTTPRSRRLTNASWPITR